MKTLVVGSGGRCHALVSGLARSPKVTQIFAAPGNAGIAAQATCINLEATDIQGLIAFVKQEHIDLTVVGPEAALALGIVDEFEKEGLTIFGPSKAATQIESSKEFAKQLMAENNIPTASYAVFTAYEPALAYVTKIGLPLVIKYDGLAAGKGVVIPQNAYECNAVLEDMLLNTKYGEGKVVIEEFLEGPEFSFMCLVNGEKVYPLELAQDHKRAFNGDKGPNTGGMGAYSPVPLISQAHIDEALNTVMKPIAQAMVDRGTPFKGLLYGGLMLTKNGIKVIEFNARFGDPETEVVLPRLTSDLFDALYGIATNQAFTLSWTKKSALGIVLASKGYPGTYKKGALIKNLDQIEGQVFHMGTKFEDGMFRTNGGRVLFVTVLADTLEEAQTKANKEVSKIECPNLFHRKDIGWQMINPKQ